MQIRPERPEDSPEIHALVRDVFGQIQEAKLVDGLRETNDLVISLVAEKEGQLVGHVAVSRLKSPERALALAPVAVSVQEQRSGIGSLLVRESLKQAERRGCDIVFVVGEPSFYSRFGFSIAAAAPFPCSYAGPYFMARLLTDNRMAPSPVVYAAPFNKCE